MHKSPNIELLRIIGALGIVWYHARGPGFEAAYGGLVSFLILSLYLAGGSAERPPRVSRRAQRLLAPWLLWMAVYGAVNLATHQPLIPLDYGLLAGLLAGTSIHLWYLPFIFFCLIGYDQLRQRVRAPMLAISGAIVAFSMLAATPMWRPFLIVIGYPVAQYLHALAGLGLGSYFANAQSLPRYQQILLVTLLLFSAVFALPYHGVGLPYLLGIIGGCLLAAPALPSGTARWINPLGAATFGVYCCHILVMRVLAKFTHIDGWQLPVGTFIVSIALVLLWQRLRLQLRRRTDMPSASSGSRL